LQSQVKPSFLPPYKHQTQAHRPKNIISHHAEPRVFKLCGEKVRYAKADNNPE
jgi:hypothetical protein